MDKVRWGVLGNANIARKALVPAIKAAGSAELKGIASRQSKKAERAAEELGFDKHYGSYEALLADPEIDAVYIPLPNGLHAEWVAKAAKAGKHVLCEKPAALTAAEAAKMIEECRRHEVLFMEAFMYQFHPQHERVKEIIADGEIGDVRVMRSQFSFAMKDPANVRLNRELGGGCLYDVGCYCIHAARYILAQEPSKVYAQAHLDAEFDNVDMTTAGMLSFEKDIQLLFDCSFESFPQENYQVIGEKGNIQVTHPFRPDKNKDGKARIYITTEDGEKREESIPGEAYALQVEHFSQCVLDGTEPVYSGEQTIQNMKVIDACYESIRSGETVELRR
ncbi:MAG TPA: Gfo/Idh/MocA family oxidoreductase [Bacillales bacterium]